MAASTDLHRPFDRILNFRDLSTAAPGLIKPRLFFRSARPDLATEADCAQLQSQYHIQTIIDLRTPTEKAESHKQKTRLAGHSSPTVAASQRLPGFTYAEVDLNGQAYANALLRHLTWFQTLRLFFLYIFNYRKEAIAVLASNVMAPRGLVGLAKDSLEHCKIEIKQVFDILARGEAYPVLLHCTQGKDRTGLIVLLVLGCLRVSRNMIERDYMSSQEQLDIEREAKVKEVKSIGLPSAFADCDPAWVEKLDEHIRKRENPSETIYSNEKEPNDYILVCKGCP